MSYSSRRIEEILRLLSKPGVHTRRELLRFKDEARSLATAGSRQPHGYDLRRWLVSGGRDAAAASAAREVEWQVEMRLRRGQFI